MSQSLTCPVCLKKISPDAAKLSQHLRLDHLVSRNAVISCSEVGCHRSFTRLDNFVRHLKNFHCGRMARSSGQLNSEPTPDGLMMPEVATEVVTTYDCTPASDLEDYTKLIAKGVEDIFLWLRSKSGVTQSVTIELAKYFNQFTKDLFPYLIAVASLPEHGLGEERARNIFRVVFDRVEEILNNFSTIHRQDMHFFQKRNVALPVEHALGSRLDQRFCDGSVHSANVSVTDPFQYVQMRHVFELLFSGSSNALEEQLVTRCQPGELGWLKSYRDGLSFAKHELFQDHPKALEIQLYYDDVEVVNPLGSKTKSHELGAFYFTIQNLPQNCNSSLKNIHLLALCHTLDIGRYGFDPILKPFIEELEELEGDRGMILKNGKRLRGTVTALVADTLAAHALFGMQSPSATYFCRLCYAKRGDIQTTFREKEFVMRDVPDYEHILSNGKLPNCGIARCSPLNNSRFFHVTKNFAFDPMHDLLEGIVPKELKLVLNYVIFEKKLISVEVLNSRISCYDYGMIEKKNKPSANFTRAMFKSDADGLKQKAAQMQCLLAHFPVLFSNLFEEYDLYLELILLLLEITDIVFSSRISCGQICQLEELIHTHHVLFKSLFPNVNLVNKHHHLVHYPTCIRMFGPIVNLSCMRYEAKHNYFKKHAHVICNFKNICKSLAYKHQIQQYFDHSGDSHDERVVIGKGAAVATKDLSVREQLHSVEAGETVYACHSVKIDGVEVRPEYFILFKQALSQDDNLPVFARISSIIVGDAKIVYFLLKPYKTLFYDRHIHGYAICEGEYSDLIICESRCMVDYKPYNIKKVCGSFSSQIYILKRPY